MTTLRILLFLTLGLTGALRLSADDKMMTTLDKGVTEVKDAMGIPDKKKHELLWLTKEEPTLLASIPAYVPNADQEKAEVAHIIAAQKNLTPAQTTELQNDAKMKVDLVSVAIAPDFATKYPVTYALLDKVRTESHAFSSKLKEKYKRNRPFVDHPEIKSLAPEKSFSYPSGHATQSETLVVVLTSLFPDKAAALEDRATTIRDSRVNAGEHYPSDVEAGKTLGAAVGQALLTKADFQKDFAAAKAEVAKK